MTKASLLATVLLVALTGPVTAQEPAPPPPALVDIPTAPPRLATISKLDLAAGHIEEHVVVVRQVTETRERIVIVDGVPRPVLYTVLRNVYETHAQQHAYASLRAVTPDGKDIPADKLAERVKAGAIVLLATDPAGNISTSYTKLLKEDAIILLGRPAPKIEPPPK